MNYEAVLPKDKYLINIKRFLNLRKSLKVETYSLYS